MAIKKRAGKTKTKKITFRLSYRQKKMIDRYCKAHKFSNIKLIKNALKEYMLRHFDLPAEQIVSKNQMNIFDLIDDADDSKNNEAAEPQKEYEIKKIQDINKK